MDLQITFKNIFTALCLLFFSCSDDPKPMPETAVEVGREFIRATLDGDFRTAENLLLEDPRNTALFESYKTFYTRLPAEKKAAYKKASYTINTFRDLNDTVSLINYSNTYMNQPMNVKIVRRGKAWRIDFKYTSEDQTSIN